MCNPVALAALSVGSSAASIWGNKKSTEAQAKAMSENTQRANDAALRAYEIDTQQMGLSNLQDMEAAADEKFRIQLDTQKAAATARAASAESGLAGYSLDAQIDDITKQGLDNLTTLDANIDAMQANQTLERKALHESAKNRQQTFDPYQPSSSVFYTGAALQLGGSGVQGYATGKSLKG